MPRHPKQPNVTCPVIKDIHNFVTGCGMRINYNKRMKYCPYCGKPLTILVNVGEENEDNDSCVSRT